MKTNCYKNFIIIFLMMQCLFSTGQISKETYRKMPYVSKYSLIEGNDSINPYYISQNPITNREYITYLCWLYSIYSGYGEVLVYAFPGLKSEKIDSIKKIVSAKKPVNRIPALISLANEQVAGYLFNPKYIDYPVIGVTWGQAMNFCRWLSDRYNEAILIKRKLLLFDLKQRGCESFVMETYLAREYVGVVGKNFISNQESIIKWDDRIFFPTFRLPSSTELSLANANLKKEVTSYKPNKFLTYWTDYYIDAQGVSVILKNIDRSKIRIICTFPSVTSQKLPDKTGELSLDAKLVKKRANIFDIFKEYKQNLFVLPSKMIPKDSLGLMPYVLIGEDKNSRPIFIKRIDYLINNSSSGSSGQNNIFRFALNAVK